MWLRVTSLIALGMLGLGTISLERSWAQTPTDSLNGKDQWPVYRGTSLATGVAASPLPEKLTVAWKFAEDLGPVEATPVVLDGIVYVGDVDGHFVALDLQTGKLKWRQKFETGFISSAAVNESLVIVGDYDGTCEHSSEPTVVSSGNSIPMAKSIPVPLSTKIWYWSRHKMEASTR
jgi:hypothetical protein